MLTNWKGVHCYVKWWHDFMCLSTTRTKVTNRLIAPEGPTAKFFVILVFKDDCLTSEGWSDHLIWHVLQKKCDNLLVETEIFAIFGISFCATQNAFNLMKIKNKNIGAQFQHVFYYSMSPFPYFMDLLVLVAPQKLITHLDSPIVIFDGCWLHCFYTN